MCTACGRWIGSTGRCTRCRLTRALPTPLRHLGVPLLLLGLAVGLTAALPTAVEAVNTCNTFAAIDYTAGPNFGLQGDTYRVKLSLFTGSITGGTKVNVTRVRFNLDCTDATAGTLNCTDLGAIISYSGDATITTDCPTGWTTANAANSTSPNQVVLTAGTPFDIPANTGTPAVPFCELEFDVKIANLPSPAQAAVAQTAGFDQTQSDGSCDNTPTPLKATGTQSGSINLCPTCTDEECNTVTCDQSAGTCTVLTPSNEGNACTGAAGTPNSCQQEVCRTGACVIETNPAEIGQACTFGTPVTNAECQHKLCAADGTCPVSNFNEGGTCDNASPPPTNPQCQEQVCQSGACVVEDISPPPAVCVAVGICRTPGFWGTHACPGAGGQAGCEQQGNSCAQNITQAVIDANPNPAHPGQLVVCGQDITNTLLGDHESAVEAICVRVQGHLRLQLARQLTAAALNCILSGSDDTCVNLSIETTFSECDDVCKDAGSTNAQIGPCVDAIDCFNNGGQFDAATGHCTSGPDNCELRDLPLATLGLTACHDKSGNLVQGSSGSSNECSDARRNQITIFP